MEIIQEVRKTQVQVKRIKLIIYMIWHGNVFEWTQEANRTDCRVERGGYYNINGSFYPVTTRSSNNPTNSFVYYRFSPNFNLEPVTPDSDTV